MQLLAGFGFGASATYDEFAEWYGDRSKDLQFEIKIGKGNKAVLEATIAKEAANSDDLTAKIEYLSAVLEISRTQQGN